MAIVVYSTYVILCYFECLLELDRPGKRGQNMIGKELTMDYVKFGEGARSFIVLPGISIHSVMGLEAGLAEAFKEFTDEYTVYVFDRVREMPDDYTVRQMAIDTAEAIKELGLKDVDIFGASQGGMIAQYIAIDHPELVRKVILGSTLASGNDGLVHVADEWIRLAESKDEVGLLGSFADNVCSESTLAQYRDIMIEANLGITDEEYRRFIIQAKAAKEFDCSAELDKIKCKVLVMGSKGDKVVGVKGSEDIAKALGCEIYLYDESFGHSVYDEAPDYRPRCLAFLKSADE